MGGEDEFKEGLVAPEPWQQVYGRHSGNEIYHIQLHKSLFFSQYEGETFPQASADAHHRFGVALLAVLDSESPYPRLQLNPGPDYRLKNNDYCFYMSVTREEYSKISPEALKSVPRKKNENIAKKNIGKSCKLCSSAAGQLDVNDNSDGTINDHPCPGRTPSGMLFIVTLESQFIGVNGSRPDILFLDTIAQFPLVYYMMGKIQNVDDLLVAGINQASHLVVVNRDSDSDYGGEEILADSETIVAVQTIFRLFPNTYVVTELSQASNMRFMQFSAQDIYSKKASRLEQMHHFPRLPFAAGQVFSASMLDTLLYQTFVKGYLISFVRLLLGIDAEEGSGHLSSIRVKRSTVQKFPEYGDLYDGLCSATGEIPFAIYRTEKISNIDTEDAPQTFFGENIADYHFSNLKPKYGKKHAEDGIKPSQSTISRHRFSMICKPDQDDLGDLIRDRLQCLALTTNDYKRKLRPHEITDDIIVSRLDGKILKELCQDPDMKLLESEIDICKSKFMDAQNRVEQIAAEKLLADAFCMNHYVMRQQQFSHMPAEYRRQQSDLYNRLRPNQNNEMNLEEVEEALQQINHNLLTDKEFYFLYSVLDLPRREKINFRLFTIIAALSEKVTQLDPVVRKLINKFDYNALDIKMEKCKELFELLESDHVPKGAAQASSLAVELTAGGLRPEHTRYVMTKFNRDSKGFIDFLDFVTYVPLFVEIHQRIITDPLNGKFDL
ncbi:potassium channel, sub T, member 2, partial [Bulinus truncatus]